MPGLKRARAREDLMDVERTMARYVRARTDLQIRASNFNHNSHGNLILDDGSSALLDLHGRGRVDESNPRPALVLAARANR